MKIVDKSLITKADFSLLVATSQEKQGYTKVINKMLTLLISC